MIIAGRFLGPRSRNGAFRQLLGIDGPKEAIERRNGSPSISGICYLDGVSFASGTDHRREGLHRLAVAAPRMAAGTLECFGGCAAAPAYLPADHPPLLLVVIDTEEEFDWSLPHSRENTRVEAISAQGLAQEIFARHGIVPTYVIDYPVAATPSAVRVLRAFQDRGECHIGAHLHPWVNPPHKETVSAWNSYPGNLPPALERAKLKVLTEMIAKAFGRRPTVYKAGRYGVGPATAELLEDLGYLIDVSVVPFTSFGEDGGPDFSQMGFQPTWFGPGDRLLEIPLSCGFHGTLRSLGPKVFPKLSSPSGMRLRMPGVLARTGLLERIRLTPEGVDFAANVRLARSLYQQGARVFTLTYHSPSLVAGMTPYVSTESDLSAFLETLDRFFSFFAEELGGRPSTPQEVYKLLRNVPEMSRLAEVSQPEQR